MIAFSEIYQAALDSSNVQNLIDRVGEYILNQNGQLASDTLGNLIIDSQEIIYPFYTPAEKLAFKGHFFAAKLLENLGANQKKIVHALAKGGHHSQLEPYMKKYGQDERFINTIANGYAISGYHDQVRYLHHFHKASVNKIAQGYARGDHQYWVELYREIYHAHVNSIAKGYAQGGFHSKVKIYHTKHAANLSAISTGYFQGGYDEQGEEYQKISKKNKLSYEKILHIYQSIGNCEKFLEFSTKCLLLSYGEQGKTIIKIMNRLKKGQRNPNNLYWKGAQEKLTRIINAVNTCVKPDGSTDLAKLLQDKKSNLYQALNFFRLGNISFFGRFSTKKTKSLLVAQEKIISTQP